MTKFLRGAILGPPGSGKGTLSEKIIGRFNIVHVSTGDILRKNIKQETELGNSVKKYMKEGKLVPDVLIMRIALDQLEKISSENWLLDGFPRTIIQAEKLFMKYPLHLAINLNVPFEVIINRIKGRYVHPPSGRVYNLEYKPPKVPGKDDVTGEELVQREDDCPEAVSKRLEIYEKTMTPLLKFYKKEGILRNFDGDSSDQIWPKVENELLKFMKPKS